MSDDAVPHVSEATFFCLPIGVADDARFRLCSLLAGASMPVLVSVHALALELRATEPKLAGAALASRIAGTLNLPPHAVSAVLDGLRDGRFLGNGALSHRKEG